MKSTALVVALGALRSTGSAHALTVTYTTEGPMMRDARLANVVGPQIGGPIAALADLDTGGKHRLSVRLNSKYFSDDKSFLYFVEFDVQQRVTDRDGGNDLGHHVGQQRDATRVSIGREPTTRLIAR